MKSNYLFCDQINSVTALFENWSECEQTAALCTLFKQVSPTQCRFLAQVLEQTDCSEVSKTEEDANNPGYISKLASESKEVAITKLLAHLPLLRTGNHQAKVEYLKLISSVLNYTIQNGAHCEESRQIISYSLMHPAISSDERSDFTMWIGKLEERFTYSIGGCQSQKSKPSKEEDAFTSFSQSLQEKLPHVSSTPNFPNNGHKPLGSRHLNGWSSPQQGEPLVITNLEPPPVIVPSSGTNTGGLLTIQQNRVNHQHQPPVTPSSLGMVGDRDHQSSFNHPIMKNQHLPLQPVMSAPANYTSSVPSSQPSGVSTRSHAPLRRTPSVVPPGAVLPSNVDDWLHSNDDSVSRGRSHSSTSDHAPLSPQSSITSSGSSSDTHQDEGPQPVKNSFLEEGSGMRDVPLWLKSLRLHKYAYIFQQMSYEEMLNLSEEWLESQNVTKGARTKIVVSLNKLKERQNLLRSLEKDIVDGGSIKAALSEMKNIINSPLKMFPSGSGDSSGVMPTPQSPAVADGDASCIAEGDIPAQFTRLMGKVCTQLLVTSRPDDECFNFYLGLIDKCINHEAFTNRQKKLLASWKQEMQRIYQTLTHKYQHDKKIRAGWGNTFPLGSSLRGGLGQRTPVRLQKSGTQWSFGAKRSILGGTTSSGHMPVQRNSSLNPAIFSRPGIMEQQTKQMLSRTQSAPIRTPNLGFAVVDDLQAGDNADNYAQLDSLCLSVTEHALGSLETGEKGSTF